MSRPPHIQVSDLSKHFRVSRREGGLRAAIRALFRRDWDTVRAVEQVGFEVSAGERVALLGPNGAGKTTTLKLLAGLLHPTAGSVNVAGHTPSSREASFLRSIALVMGQKRQLSWDLPALDTFELNRVVYGVSHGDYRQRLDEMVELLDLGEVVGRPVRQLSLGERMKCEIVAALLHKPKIIFLDEPTLGMDVTMQLKIRHFIRDYNERYGATVVLTSHDMGDVAALCSRVLLIADGSLRFDGDIDELVKSVRPVKRVSVTIPDKRHRVGMSAYGMVVKREERVVLDVERDKVSEVIAHLLSREGVRDLEVIDPPLEEVLREVFERRKSPT